VGDWEAESSVDLHWLTEQIAVGAAFPMERAAHLAETHGIRAIIDLREEDCDDESRLRKAGIELLHLPTLDQTSPTNATLDRGVAFARNHVANGNRLLIHCQGGIGRSPLLALCVLVDLGFEPLDALAHAKNCREAVSPSYDQYCGWARWLEGRGKAAPDYHTFGCIAYRHLAQG
jgi:protein-tyrosine phosphatase